MDIKEYYDLKGVASYQYLTFIFMEQAGCKYEELCINLENDWHKGKDNFPDTVDKAYSLLKICRGSRKFISNIVKKSKQNDRSDYATNSNH